MTSQYGIFRFYFVFYFLRAYFLDDYHHWPFNHLVERPKSFGVVLGSATTDQT